MLSRAIVKATLCACYLAARWYANGRDMLRKDMVARLHRQVEKTGQNAGNFSSASVHALSEWLRNSLSCRNGFEPHLQYGLSKPRQAV